MKLYLKILFFISFLIISNVLSAQIKEQDFESIEQTVDKDPKFIIIFIHTDWCMYCKSMENSTFKNPEIINKLNNDFYFISFNAENQETVFFREREFKYIPNGKKTGVHQLAIELGMINNKISYPTLTILNDKYEIVFQHSSYLNTKQLNQILEKLNDS
ncbi:thioredoxin family protein [Aquimarina sp. 2304DJ70-9]|uniref:thioredoxin family protein n=1 Tax=Aquimarina penaris TaxID=3231044 RepID=UPI00346206DA